MSSKPLSISMFLVFFACGSISAAQPIEPNQLKLVPTPQRAILLNGIFRIQKTTPVVLAKPQDPNDSYAAQQLIEEIQQRLGFRLEITRLDTLSSKPSIIIGQLDRDRSIDDAVQQLRISLDPHLGSDSYVLSITPKKILIAAKDSAGAFYGIQTLKQIIRANRTGDAVPCCLIQDWPGLKFRAWLEDVTRGPIPKMETLKRKIRAMAEFKANMLTLYTEHVFKLNKHPKLSPPDGLTAEEIKELSDYARKHHVDLVGNFQSLAHFWNILKHPEYAHLKETTDVVTPAKEEAYEFLKDVYSEVAPAYSSKYFHVCGDEAFALGQGPARKMVKEMGVGGVYAYHFNRINSLLKPHGKTLMIWCDMMIHRPDDLKKLPEDIILIPWTYNTWKVDNYDRLIKPVVDTGRRVMVCSGIMNWGQMWPDFSGAIKNNAMWTRECFNHKGLGIFNTSWLDSGEALYDYNWYPFMWGAECAWMPVLSEKDKSYDTVIDERLRKFDQAFDAAFYGSPDGIVTATLKDLDGLRKYSTSQDKGDWMRLTNRVFWNDPFQHLDYDITDDADTDPAAMLTDAQKVMNALQEAKKTTPFNADTIDYPIFAVRRICFVAKRALTHNAVVRYKRDGKGSLKQIQKDFELLTDDLKSLKDEYVRLWNQENRASWLEHVLAKYDRLLGSMTNRDIRVIMPPVDIFTDAISVELGTYLGLGEIYYTCDGAEPTKSSTRYIAPFVLKDTTVVKARAYDQDRKSTVSRKQFTKLDDNDGIAYSYYESKHPRLWGKLPDFDILTPVKTGKARDFDISLRDKDDFFAFTFSGFINIATEGDYTFYVKSDDGGRLFIDGKEIVNNDGLHGSVERKGNISLTPGKHVVSVLQFDATGYESLTVSYEGPNIKKQPLKCCK